MAAESDKERYLSDFRRFRAHRLQEPAEAKWMAPIRDAAIARFAEIGFPSSREEEWRYTNVARLIAVPFRQAFEVSDREAPLPEAEHFASSDAIRLVFVNGRFLPGASRLAPRPSGLEVLSLAELLAAGGERLERHLARHAKFDRNGFTALSTAFLEDGAFVSIADGEVIGAPIELVFLASAAKGEVVSHPRILITCGQGSQATVVESYASLHGGSTLTNAVAEVALAEGARLRHVRIAKEG